ncbi:MAG: hypothetical protein K2K02_08950 [Ruminococcus sp.]|nr:hypothetical protein [Ruminococcus sp.]
MKIALDKQTTEVHIKKNATNVDFNRCFWNATFITDFKTDGNIREFTRLLCTFLNDCSDRVKVGDTATTARIVADSRTGCFSFSLELIEMTTLTTIEVN